MSTTVSAPGDYRVRRAEPADVEPSAVVLAESFQADPWMSWTVDARRRHERVTQLYRLVLGELAVPYGAVWLCESLGEAGAQLVGAAGWFTPATDPPTHVWGEVQRREVRLRGRRAEAYRRAESLLEVVRPRGPHWHLGVVGVLAAHRRRGVATRLLQPGLLTVDEQRVEAYLETSEAANVRLYERLGFAVIAAQRIEDGPTVWSMRRRPHAHQTSS